MRVIDGLKRNLISANSDYIANLQLSIDGAKAITFSEDTLAVFVFKPSPKKKKRTYIHSLSDQMSFRAIHLTEHASPIRNPWTSVTYKVGIQMRRLVSSEAISEAFDQFCV